MKSRKFKLSLLILVTMVTLFFGLRPFDFFPENGVRWLGDGDGIQFYRQDTSVGRATGGVVYTPAPVDMGSRPDTFEPCTIEIHLEAHTDGGDGLAHIVSFRDGYPRSSLVIGQWRTELIIRIRDNQNRARDTYREIDLRDGLKPNEQKLITIASGRESTDIYVNGEPAKSYRIPSLIGVEHFSGHLNLGNSSIGHNPWAGNLYGLAFYDRVLTSGEIRQHCRAWADRLADVADAVESAPMIWYTFAERAGDLIHDRASHANHLTIPPTFKALRTAVVVRFWQDMDWGAGAAKDIVVNIAGFVPFALCVLIVMTRNSRMSPKRAAFVTVLAGATLSLVIEIGQIGLPMRTPSSLDLLCNTAGAALGIVVFRMFHAKKSHR